MSADDTAAINTTNTGLRATGDRVLVVRVFDRSKLIAHVFEELGVTDRVFQFGEVVGLGSEWTKPGGKFRHLEMNVGDLVVYPTPRVYDHFKHHFEGKGTVDVQVVPGYWVAAIVTGTYVADHPEDREFGPALI